MTQLDPMDPSGRTHSQVSPPRTPETGVLDLPGQRPDCSFTPKESRLDITQLTSRTQHTWPRRAEMAKLGLEATRERSGPSVPDFQKEQVPQRGCQSQPRGRFKSPHVQATPQTLQGRTEASRFL